MSDGISRIELKAAGAYSRYSEEPLEVQGLLRAAPDLGVDGAAPRGAEGAAAARKAYDDEDLLPAMIENGLEKIGVL
jgi:hypothetical protein